MHQMIYRICIFYLLFLATNVVSESIIVSTAYGPIVGKIEQAYGFYGEVYESVPYARPPIGELRFESPKEPESWTQPWNTTTHVSCPQYDMRMSVSKKGESEDCLHLKIVIPLDSNKRRYKEKLPVLYWIHGGSYIIYNKQMYKTKGILRNFAAHKIIFVAVEYRLGIEGFLTMMRNDLHGNFGLEDMLMGLRFIRENADHFGVDINRITISGESAGAAAAGLLAASPKTKGQLAGALVFSGSSQAKWAVRTQFTEINSAIVINFCNCSRPTVIEVKRCMQQVNSYCFLEALRLVANLVDEKGNPTSNDKTGFYENLRMGFTYFSPVIDAFRINDSVLPLEATELLRQHAKVPTLIANAYHDRVIVAKAIGWQYKRSDGRMDPMDGPYLVEQFVPTEIPSYRAVRKAILNRYFAHQHISREEIAKEICDFLTDEMMVDTHQESLLYAANNVTIYNIVTDVHDNENGGFNLTETTSHGFDVGLLFEDFAFVGGGFMGKNSDVEKFRNFTEKFSNILAEFVHNQTVVALPKFTSRNRIASRITSNNNTEMEFEMDTYYFWRQLIPTLEQLNLHETRDLHAMREECEVCQPKFKLPFFALLISMILLIIVAVAVVIRHSCKHSGNKYILTSTEQ